MCMCPHLYREMRRPEEGAPRTRITHGCKLPDVGPGNGTPGLQKSSQALLTPPYHSTLSITVLSNGLSKLIHRVYVLGGDVSGSVNVLRVGAGGAQCCSTVCHMWDACSVLSTRRVPPRVLQCLRNTACAMLCIFIHKDKMIS